MKLTTLYALPMVALGAKVPRDSPVRKILKLKRFANEWLSNHFGQDSKVHQHWMQKISRNALRFKARYEDCGNTEDEFVDKIMAAWLAAQAAQEEQTQSRKRRAKGGQGGKRGRGKGGKNRKPKEIKIPTEFRRYNKSDSMQGINDIFTGFSKWAARYISACKNQPEVQQARAAKWSAILQGKLTKHEDRQARQAARQ